MFVRNACTNDVRVLREASTLSEAGWPTTIVALQPGGSQAPPDHEERDGVWILRVPAPADWRVRWRDMRYYPWRVVRGVPRLVVRALRSGPSGIGDAIGIVAVSLVTLPYTLVQAVRYVASRRARPRPHDAEDGLDHLAWWRFSALGWATAAAAAAPPGEVYHGHDLTGLPAALRAARRDGGRAMVIYDSHELFLEAGAEARKPWWVRRILSRLERKWITGVDGIVTVNASIADELRRRYDGPSAVVVRNAPPRLPIGATRPDHLRSAAGIPAAAPVVLYHGGFQRDRGLEVLAEAMAHARMERAHLVFLGFGPLTASLEAFAAEARFGGRLHVLPAVPTDELLALVASADVSAMPNQPRTLNERYSTPNKLFESLAVGTPVVSSDFPERRRIVVDDPDGPLGAVCDPTRPAAVAAALDEVLSLSPEAMADLRRRCQRAAHERYNWEQEGAELLGLYARLAGT
jgi:glycosyltransferase involved in cell wall biosynthesis